MSLATRPAADEHLPYYSRYVERVPDGELLTRLERQGAETAALLRTIPEGRASHRYAPGKWSVKEVVGHISDTERIFSYRALRIARADRTPLAGFDENGFVRAAGFDRRTLRELVDELVAVRAATVALYRGLGDEEVARRGTANGAEVSVRALAWITAGHELHHVALLRERYGVGERSAVGEGSLA